MNYILSIALCGALFFILVFWILFAACCFHAASAETKKDIPEPVEEEPATDTSICLIGYAVDHIRWKAKRGYLWEGGWKYGD